MNDATGDGGVGDVGGVGRDKLTVAEVLKEEEATFFSELLTPNILAILEQQFTIELGPLTAHYGGALRVFAISNGGFYFQITANHADVRWTGAWMSFEGLKIQTVSIAATLRSLDIVADLPVCIESKRYLDTLRYHLCSYVLQRADCDEIMMAAIAGPCEPLPSLERVVARVKASSAATVTPILSLRKMHEY